MEKFPLLRLPAVPLKKVVKELNFILLALCSEKMGRVVASMRFKTSVFKINHTAVEQNISVSFKTLNLQWNFVVSSDASEYNYKYTFEGQAIKFNIIRLHWRYFTINSLCGSPTAKTVEHFLRKTFVCENIDYKIDGKGCPNIENYILEKVNKDPNCKSLSLGAIANVHMNNSSRPKPFTQPIKEENLEFVFKNLVDRIELIVVGDPGKKFRYYYRITQKNVTLRTPKYWFTFQNLIGARCESLILSRNERSSHCNLNPEQLNNYLKRWIDGKQPDISYLYVELQWYPQKTEKWSQLTAGIELLDFDAKRNDEDYG
ncbi:hypothetical protein GCK72_011911 [Caenorhabditis remanei]|uniref:Sdz-33 F-box domain-containing protein n=1 Tax=Caenorhabditis remanei TaxID=31234 RepID=A0A6A5H9Y6_CAERE|nr:hypothetical protein GCK72_011911 [Caenorhabditis remanei]KAF1763644.1 hypothetical protein GCK72_011911 [Caenorhabditis remanei]